MSDGPANPGPPGEEDIEGQFRRGIARSRRRLTAAAVLAITAVVAVSAALAISQYRGAQRSALNDLRSRTVVAAAVVDAAFAGDINTLQAVASAPAVVESDQPGIQSFLTRLQGVQGRQFNGGLGWIDRNGVVRASTTLVRSNSHATVRDRAYFTQVMATGKPYVSGGLIGRALGKPVVVVAVPTRDSRNRLSGVLVGSIELKSVRNQKTALELGYAGLEIVDRSGLLLLDGLAPVRNKALLARVDRGNAAVLDGTPGLSGQGGHAVAYATAAVPSWRIVIDRPQAAVFAAARRALALQLASVGAAALVVLAMVGYVVRRARRDQRLQESRARAWNELARALATSESPDEVADAVIESLSAAFPGALAVVVYDTIDGSRRTKTSSSGSRRVTGNAELMEEIARRATARRQSVPLERISTLRGVVDCLPFETVDGEAIGGLALVRVLGVPLEPIEWTLLGSAGRQAGQAFARTRRSEHDHDLAVGLQRRLLPEALPVVEGAVLAGHYRAGSKGLEVGGDWYDVVRRDDGVLVLSVGDVIGRGIDAAALMGRHRDAFRVHAHETASPAEIMRRLLRHSQEGELMITVACVSLDPYTGELAYSVAGHPPPLLVEPEGPVRLDEASSPPLGVADAQSIQEVRLIVSDQAAVVLYTDGLVERRGESIDHGIDVLGEIVAADPEQSIAQALSDVGAALGAPDDDVALLIARLTGEPIPFDLELPADPAVLSGLRRRLRTWLTRRGFAPGESEDILLAVSEACNNAIEHGYDGDLGSISVRVVDDEGTLRATVRDRGRWRDAVSSADRGRGIAIMRTIMDTATIDRSAEGTTVVLELRRVRQPSV